MTGLLSLRIVLLATASSFGVCVNINHKSSSAILSFEYVKRNQANKVENTYDKGVGGVGGWGGYCTCPNGQVYAVGDKMNWCGSLSCENGKPGECHKRDGEWSRNKVTCAPASSLTTTRVENTYDKGVGGVGGWGGYCTCPNGQVYAVGDKMNWCGSLSCE